MIAHEFQNRSAKLKKKQNSTKNDEDEQRTIKIQRIQIIIVYCYRCFWLFIYDMCMFVLLSWSSNEISRDHFIETFNNFSEFFGVFILSMNLWHDLISYFIRTIANIKQMIPFRMAASGSWNSRVFVLLNNRFSFVTILVRLAVMAIKEY